MDIQPLVVASLVACFSVTVMAEELFPDGFTPVAGNPAAAIELSRQEAFPGFIVLRAIDRWKSSSGEPDTISAMRLMIRCSGEAKLIDIAVSTNSSPEALLNLESDSPSGPIRSVDVRGLSIDPRLKMVLAANCKSRRNTSTSTVEIPVSATSTEVTSVIARTINAQGVAREAWIHTRATRAEPTKFSDGSPVRLPNGQPVTHQVVAQSGETAKSRITVNCAKKTIATLQYVAYAPDGGVKSESSTKGSPSVSAVVPGSVGESVMSFLCSL